MQDWIEYYVEETQRVPSPEIYRLWAAITAVSGVLERKVWTTGSAGPIYPHLFTVLVGPPASGKDNAIRPIREIWSKMQGLHLSPDNVTKAALIDALGRALRTVPNGASAPMIFMGMAASVPEFGVFFSRHDMEFLSVLNNIYTSPAMHREERRTSGSVELIKPHLVILAGTQPDFLNSFLPEEAWGMGFTSRLIMVYAEGAPPTDLFSPFAVRTDALIRQIRQIYELKGEFVWDQIAVDEVNAWNKSDCPPKPDHSKLLHYNGRRALHIIKLSMISAVSSRCELHVTVDDFERARDWLLQAEAVMPDIFRAMGAKSDQQIISDLHLHIYRLWSSVAVDKRKPIPTRELYNWLHTRVTADKINRIIETAEKTGYMKRGTYPDEWTPSPIGHFGTM